MGGENSRSSLNEVVIYYRGDRLRVTWHTSVWTVMQFIRNASYDYFDECLRCKTICLQDVVRCPCCLAKFCLQCCGCPSMYSQDKKVLKCPECGVSSVADKHKRLLTFNYKIDRSALAERQLLWKSTGECEVCKKGGSKFTCGCVLATRYCGQKCQNDDWRNNHARVCTLSRANAQDITLFKWRYQGASISNGCLRERLSSRFLDSPLTLILMLNRAVARNEDKKRKNLLERTQRQQQQTQQTQQAAA